MSHACWRTSSCVLQIRFFPNADDGKLYPPPPNLIGNINSPIKFINCATFSENKTGKCISYFHVEIVFVAWLRDLMRSKNSLSFFSKDTSEKFLILLLSYLPGFWLQTSSAFIIIFDDCHGLSCVHVRASSYTALVRVSMRGVGLRCVGLAKGFLHAATRCFFYSLSAFPQNPCYL